jgi:hypothetical protein
MESILEKSSERARGLLFGLLVNGVFSSGAEEDCPLLKMRNNFSLEEKYKYVMGLTIEEIKNILFLHEECYARRFQTKCRII